MSAASAWEVELKKAIGKLELGRPFAAGVARSGFVELAVTFEHVAAMSAVPVHHRDHFDRMLVAQCNVERLMLVTHDRVFSLRDISAVWV